MKLKSVLSTVFVSMFVFVLLTSLSFQEEWKVPEKYKNMENPYADSEDDDNIGADLWKLHCASCHGKTGNGDGKKADELESEMNDFAEEEFQSQTDGEIYYKSIFGRDEMPSFEKKIIEEEDRWLLVNYMKTFAE